MKSEGKARQVLAWGLLLALLLIGPFVYDFLSRVIHFDYFLDDFKSYQAGFEILKSGGNPYDPALLIPAEIKIGKTTFAHFFVPPWNLPLLSPFLSLPYEIARTAWLVFQFILMAISAAFLAGSVRLDQDMPALPSLVRAIFHLSKESQHLTATLIPGASLLVVVGLVWKKKIKVSSSLPYLLGASLVTTPYAWFPDHVLLAVIPILLLVRIRRKNHFPKAPENFYTALYFSRNYFLILPGSNSRLDPFSQQPQVCLGSFYDDVGELPGKSYSRKAS